MKLKLAILILTLTLQLLAVNSDKDTNDIKQTAKPKITTITSGNPFFTLDFLSATQTNEVIIGAKKNT